jgi:type I restriction enzyme, S subunit
MTPQLLFDNFERLADAPDAIPKLRAMILQLAVQGKLVPQNPDDEPASVLLEKIAAEKEELIKQGKIKQGKPLRPIRPDEYPYEVPEGWEWVRLGSISRNINYGYTASANLNIKSIRLLRITDIQNDKVDWNQVPGCEIDEEKANSYLLQGGDLLIARTGGTIGKTFLVEKPPVRSVFASYLIRVTPSGELSSKFIKLFASSILYWDQLYSMCSGTGQPNVNATSLKGLLLPLPPLHEQKRIVAKADQLLALCDELEERKKKRDEARVELNAACLHELTSPEQKKARRAWNRIQSHFDLLYDTPANVAALRKSILQLAVMGRLVPQDPSDEPSSMLLKKITAEKERLIEEGKIKRGKPLPPIRPDEVPYEVPKGWEWVRLGNLIKVTSGQALPRSRMVKGSIPVFGGNGITGYHNAANIDGHTVVIGRVGFYCGSVHETPEKAWITDNAFITAFPESYLFRPFVIWLLRATNLRQKDSATAQPVISGSKIYPLLVPLAPLPEQKRIVAKVDRLMALCDKLEAELVQSQKDCDVLLSATVNQVESVS